MYLFAYFRSGRERRNRQEYLHYALSKDGLRWNSLNNNAPVYRSPLGDGILRDPFLIHCKDGFFRMIYTIRPQKDAIGYAKSTDLIHWTDEKSIVVMKGFEDVHHSWAPSCIYDEKNDEYMLYWCSSLNGVVSNNIHYYCITKDWKKFTETKILFSPGYQTIDGMLENYNNKYYLFFKDECNVYEPERQPYPPGVKLAIADNKEGPYKIISDFITPEYTEAPEIIRIDDKNCWYLYFDYWIFGKYGIMKAKNLIDWELVPEEEFSFPTERRHGTFIKIDDNIAKKLKEKY